MIETENYDKIMSDRSLFNEVVYTPLSKALEILEERQKDSVLMKKIEELLKGDIPEVLKKKKCGVMCRQLATPNFDIRFFLSICKDNDLTPVFYEYLEDKFVPDNEFKHSLGKIIIHDKLDKTGNFIEEKITIIDFNQSNGKKITEIKTLNKELLVDFHHNLFHVYDIKDENLCFINGSDWVKKNGMSASKYYTNLFLLFISHGVLFENFMMNGEEGIFSKEKVFPAIKEVYQLTGFKPIIVPIPPMEVEEDNHWVSHSRIVKDYIHNIY